MGLTVESASRTDEEKHGHARVRLPDNTTTPFGQENKFYSKNVL